MREWSSAEIIFRELVRVMGPQEDRRENVDHSKQRETRKKTKNGPTAAPNIWMSMKFPVIKPWRCPRLGTLP